MAYRVILGVFLGAFALAAVGAVITTEKQVHDHKIAALESGRHQDGAFEGRDRFQIGR